MLGYLARRVALLLLIPIIVSYVTWFLGGGLAAALNNNPGAKGKKTVKDSVDPLDVIAAAPGRLGGRVQAVLGWLWAQPLVQVTVLLALAGGLAIAVCRYRARRETPRVLMRLRPYRTDQASGSQLVAMYDAIGKALLERWWRRIASGQQAAALRVRYARDKRGITEARFYLLCPESRARSIQSALLGAYPNLTFEPLGAPPAEEAVPVVLRLKKRTSFVNRLREVDPREDKPMHPNQMDRLLSRMDNVAEGVWIDLILTPPPQSFSHLARRAYRKRQKEVADARGEEPASFAPTPLEQKELEGSVDIAHHQLFFSDLRVIADTMHVAERVAAELKVEGSENTLVERGTYLRHRLLRLYTRRVLRGDSQPIPGFNRSVLASSELAALFHLPSVNYTQVRVARHSVPRAPAPPEIYRPENTRGILEDVAGPVALHPPMRSQNMAVVGTVKQGKTSLLVASIAEDLVRRNACVILLDPKGDAASAAATIVPPKRECVILDMANPIVGYNPLAAPAAPDVVADYVVEAMKNIFDEGDIRASSDRYLRNAIMAALAAAEVDTQQSRAPTLEDAVKLLSPTDSGGRERERVSALIRSNPRWVNIHQFFAEELEAQLRDAKAMTTAKLDAPANKAARFLNSPSMQAIFKNTHYPVDFTDIIRSRKVLIVKGALGSMGKENTAVLMQLLVGGLDAALARQQDDLEARDRSAVCLKVDEAPLVLNRGFTSTMALKRSAGLEVLAAWQTDSMWEDDDQRAQLDALFAHRCYFQTASADDARHAGNLMMAEYSDQVSTEQHGGRLKHRLPPDVQLHLRPHHALCTWTTPDGRAQPFTATTRPLPDDRRWWDYHLARLAAKGAKRVTELVDPGDPTFPEIPAGSSAPEAAGGGGSEPGVPRVPTDDPVIGTVTPPLADPGREAASAAPPAGDGPPTARKPGFEPAEPDGAPEREPLGVVAGRADLLEEDATAPAESPTNLVEGWELPVMDAADTAAAAARVEKDFPPSEDPVQLTAPDECEAEPEAPAPPKRVRRVKIDDEETKEQIERAARPARQAARTTSPLRKLGSFDGDAPPSFAVFADLDACRRWTHVKTAAHQAIEKQKPMPERPSRERLQPLDMVALARIAEMRFMLADQIGDRFMPDKDKRSVQRQIKLWEDLGLIRRMQFWKKASGASRGPVALYVTDACIEMLKVFPTRDGLLLAENFDSKGPVVEDDAAHFPRHDVRVAAWVSKLEMLAGRLATEIRGPRSAFLRPPRPRERKDPRPAIGPADLNSTGRGYEVLDLTDGYGKPAETFNKIEPDAGVLITTRNGDNIRRIDVLIELDRTGEPIKNARKFARYDQLITGWAEAHPRYARFGEGPMAVFVCKDGNQAREFAKAADDIVTGARARTGVPQRDWEYPGRRRMFFVAEGDIHQGMLDSLRLENLPPAVRNADKPKGRRSFNPERVEFFSPSLFTRRNGS